MPGNWIICVPVDTLSVFLRSIVLLVTLLPRWQLPGNWESTALPWHVVCIILGTLPKNGSRGTCLGTGSQRRSLGTWSVSSAAYSLRTGHVESAWELGQLCYDSHVSITPGRTIRSVATRTQLYGPIKLRIVHDDEFQSRRRNESDNGSVPYPLQLIRRFQGWACFGNCVPVDTLVYIPHRIFPYKVSGIRPVWEPDQVC